MNLYDLLTDYNPNVSDRSFDVFYMWESDDGTPYMCFSTSIKLTANITVAVSISKYHSSVHFFDVVGNELVQVIFDYNITENKVTLFNFERIDYDDCVKIYNTIFDITECECIDNNITHENLSVLSKLSENIIKMLKQNETIKKNVL